MDISWTNVLIIIFTSGAAVSLIDFMRDRKKAGDLIPAKWAEIAARLSEDIERERQRREQDIADIREEAEERELGYKEQIQLLTQRLQSEASAYIEIQEKFRILQQENARMKQQTNSLLRGNALLRKEVDLFKHERTSMVRRIADLETILDKYGLSDDGEIKSNAELN